LNSNSTESVRTIRILAVHMDRHETHLDAEDLEQGERRPFRLDRILRADVVELDPARAKFP
jgi:predicted DNA-binding transcriptional regulator YafY